MWRSIDIDLCEHGDWFGVNQTDSHRDYQRMLEQCIAHCKDQGFLAWSLPACNSNGTKLETSDGFHPTSACAKRLVFSIQQAQVMLPPIQFFKLAESEAVD